METKICQDCKFFKQPKCVKLNEFKARKTNGCEKFKINKKKNISIPKKTKKKKSDNDIINEIFGERSELPKRLKIKRSKQRIR